MNNLLEQKKFECRVSTVLDKNNRMYGKNHMFDNCPETCWNSDSGTPQWVIIKFEDEVTLQSFEIEFQGGFVGKNCHIEAEKLEEETTIIEHFYPEDNNTVQCFKLQKSYKGRSFKFVFNESTDFFGRIIIYKLALYS